MSPSSENIIDEKSVIPGFTDKSSFSLLWCKFFTSFQTFGLGPTKSIFPLKHARTEVIHLF